MPSHVFFYLRCYADLFMVILEEFAYIQVTYQIFFFIFYGGGSW